MNLKQCRLGTVVCLRGHDIALTISDGPDADSVEGLSDDSDDGTDIVEVSWFNANGDFCSQRLECGILVPWPSTAPDGAFEDRS